MNSVQLKDIVFSKNTPIIDCKFAPLFFDIFGGVLVSTGLFDLSVACGGFLVTS